MQSSVFKYVARTLAAMGVAFGVYCTWALVYYGADSREFGFSFAKSDGVVSVTSVDPAGPASAVLKNRDRILEIAGSDFVAKLPPAIAIRAIQRTGHYDVRISRDGVVKLIPLQLTSRRDWQLAKRQSPFLIGALVCFVIALLLLKRLDDFSARLFFALLLCFGVRQALLVLHPFYNLLSGIEQYVVLAAWFPEPFYLLIAFEFHAMYRFPPSAPQSRWWTALQMSLYGTYVGFFIRSLVLGRSELPIADTVIYFYSGRAVYGPADSPVRETITLVYGMVALVAICLVVARNYKLIDNIGQRRRMRWIMFGFVAGMSPYCIVLLLQFFGETAGIPILKRGPQWAGILWALNGWLSVIPVCIGYAVARHRVFDISLVLRQGLQYLLARRMLQVLLILPAMGLAAAIATNPSRTLREFLLEGSGMFNLVLLVATAGSLRYRQKLLTLLDRRFFRQVYDSEAILMSLPEKLRDLRSPSEVAAKVAADVSAALHPSAIYVLALQPSSGQFTTVYSSDGKTVNLPDDGQVWQKALRPVSEWRLTPETLTLATLGVRWIVPLALSDERVAGLLLLAERKSEEPYSARDQQLLEAIAAQAAMLLEKFRLEEELQRERRQLKQMAVRLGDEVINLCRECPACGTCYDFDELICIHDGQAPVVVRPVDRTIQGRYRLERLVGKGGMGAVYQATDTRLKREVAIKVMLSDLFGNEHALQRFQREAEVSARLEHPNIVRIYDFGAVGTNGAYLVMEFLRGITARRAIARDEKIPPGVVGRWMEALLAGLEVAHETGVVHRDLKPENLLLINEGESGEQIKILDFGLAKVKLLHIAEAEQLTVPGMTMGTLGYMSPEQVMGGDVDHRSDIYAVGTMALEMLLGGIPSEDEDLERLLAEAFQGEVAQLGAVLRTARAQQRSQRYTSAGDLRRALTRALAQVRVRDVVIDRRAMLRRLGVEPSSRSGMACGVGGERADLS